MDVHRHDSSQSTFIAHIFWRSNFAVMMTEPRSPNGSYIFTISEQMYHFVMRIGAVVVLTKYCMKSRVASHTIPSVFKVDESPKYIFSLIASLGKSRNKYGSLDAHCLIRKPAV